MSYFQHDDEDDTGSEFGIGVFDTLLTEIQKIEVELAHVMKQVDNQNSGTMATEIAVMGEEIETMKESSVERQQSEDPAIRYYLAVGKLEAQLEEMRQMKEMSEQTTAAHRTTLEDLEAQIEEQNAMVVRLEKETPDTDISGDTIEAVNLQARRDMNKQLRDNKILIRSLKSDLRKFIDCTAKLDQSHNPQDGSPFGYLLQALLQNFFTNGMEYMSIQDQDFDVPPSVLSHLVQAGIVRSHPEDPDKIRMEDFTCST